MKKVFISIIILTGLSMSIVLCKKIQNDDYMSKFVLINVEALSADGEVNSDCPNGCLEKEGSGCFCYVWHPYIKEYGM
jgi:hypothetical protein